LAESSSFLVSLPRRSCFLLHEFFTLRPEWLNSLVLFDSLSPRDASVPIFQNLVFVLFLIQLLIPSVLPLPRYCPSCFFFSIAAFGWLVYAWGFWEECFLLCALFDLLYFVFSQSYFFSPLCPFGLIFPEGEGWPSYGCFNSFVSRPIRS